MRLDQKPGFQRAYKKLHEKQRADVDGAIRALRENPALGERKVGDLAGVRVCKFKMNWQLALLAYTFEEQRVTLTLLALVPHSTLFSGFRRTKKDRLLRCTSLK